ncbi:hypothetical protein CLOSTMETH_02938 [[Clostridium] methylpentosum DSM 5476]|uniref:Uncharacterized protein n=1 Tax=[Clostridium] methylpentosum DSM 5476 TaxID=537013 RepID=C0EGE5_9FIRM|nr:hypothetical protein CLOSTMETH_02938 [[Clostridium] methylpentosum DSM 5476]
MVLIRVSKSLVDRERCAVRAISSQVILMELRIYGANFPFQGRLCLLEILSADQLFSQS